MDYSKKDAKKLAKKLSKKDPKTLRDELAKAGIQLKDGREGTSYSINN